MELRTTFTMIAFWRKSTYGPNAWALGRMFTQKTLYGNSTDDVIPALPVWVECYLCMLESAIFSTRKGASKI